jgi:hypothetical protein
MQNHWVFFFYTKVKYFLQLKYLVKKYDEVSHLLSPKVHIHVHVHVYHCVLELVSRLIIIYQYVYCVYINDHFVLHLCPRV